METKSKLRIFVACHKPCQVPSDDVYTPIQVGRAISSQRLDMIGDDTGDNISQKNATYCEMTAHYWVWKNVKDAEYVGVCHYRRFFDGCLSYETLEKTMGGADVIMPAAHYHLMRNYNYFLLYVCSDDFAILRASIRKQCPEYEEAFDSYLAGTREFPYNMLICRKSLFDEYAKWMFGILSECERRIKLSPYSRGKRVFGYIAEILTPVFFIKNKVIIKHIETALVTDTGTVVHSTPLVLRVRGTLKHILARMRNSKPYLYDSAHIIALKNDGIPVDELL